MTRPTSIYPLANKIHERGINILVYGPPGSGKTVLAGTAKDVLIMDSDLGTESASALGSSGHAVPVTTYGELEDVYQYLRHDKHSFKWVWWDSLTLFQDRTLIDEILVDAHMENPRQSLDVASQREYLINMNRVGRYVRQFVSLGINFGISCHVTVEEEKEADSDELIYMPLVQGNKMPSKISGYMNVVGYLARKGDESKLITARRQQYYAKDRFNALGRSVKDPTIPKIERLIRAKTNMSDNTKVVKTKKKGKKTNG